MAIKFSKKTQSVLRKLGVIAIYVFGSRAKGIESPMSDFDFGIILADPSCVSRSTAEIYEPLYNLFSTIIRPETQEADVIDIVFLDSPRVPLELKAHIVREGKLMFDDSPQARANLESRLLLQYADFAPLRKEMSATLFARI